MFNATITYRNAVFNGEATKIFKHAVFLCEFKNAPMKEISFYLETSMTLPEIEVISVSIVQA